MIYTIDRKEKMSWLERLYLPAIISGMWITAKHFFRNLFFMDKRMTVEYPEEKKKIPPGYRAEHRLLLREDGQIRCTACMLCATICPAKCIEIKAEEAEGYVEKRPADYVINELLCVFCGLCVEACPCDAIRMDTGKFPRVTFSRAETIYDKQKLLDNNTCTQSPLSAGLY